MKSFLTKLLLVVFFSVALSSCEKPLENKKAETNSSEKLKIVTTIGMISDLVVQIVKDKHIVKNVVKAGVDPHLYKATRSDIALLSSADMVFYNGLLLEGKLTDALLRVKSSGKVVTAVTESVDKKYLLSPKDFKGNYDPHLWMDPTAWIKAVEVIKAELIKKDTINKVFYEKNAKELVTKLVRLDQYCKKTVASIPQDSRTLVTAHDAFNYFSRRYGFKVVGVQGLSTESEAGVRDIQEIVQLLVRDKIKAVFIETTVSDRNVKALIEGAQSVGHKVEIGGKLFSDAMGKDGTYLGTYIGMIDHNVTTIVRALGGQAPSAGLNGKL